jgi:hypothetical protein
MEETTPVLTLDEQLDRILHPLGVRRERSSETSSYSERAHEADGVARVHLHFLSVLCAQDNAPRLKERLEALLQSAAAIEAEVLQLQGTTRHRLSNFMVVAKTPFPAHLCEQLVAWEEVLAASGFTTTLDLVSGVDGAEGTARG